MPMPNDSPEDPIFRFTAFALRCAADIKGADLDDDEIEEVLDWASWYMLAAVQGADPNQLVEVMQAEASGTQVFH
jgi:hypothetical protein